MLPFQRRAVPPPPRRTGAGADAGRAQRLHELARELSARLQKAAGQDDAAAAPDDFARRALRSRRRAEPPAEPPKAARNGDAARDTHEGRPILDRLPVGVLVYRLDELIYANRAFLDWTGYRRCEALAEAGGLDSLFIETKTRRRRQGRQQRRQVAHHHHRQRQADAGRRPAVQRRRGTARTRWC